jgi:hypothetical protein
MKIFDYALALMLLADIIIILLYIVGVDIL